MNKEELFLEELAYQERLQEDDEFLSREMGANPNNY